MRRDSERISFSIDSIARRGIASVMAWRISFNSLRNAAIDCSILSGRCNASIWLVILSRCFSSPEKSGPDGGGGAIAGAIGGALRGGIGRGEKLSSSLWRAVISAIAKSSVPGLSGGDGR